MQDGKARSREGKKKEKGYIQVYVTVPSNGTLSSYPAPAAPLKVIATSLALSGAARTKAREAAKPTMVVKYILKIEARIRFGRLDGFFIEQSDCDYN